MGEAAMILATVAGAVDVRVFQVLLAHMGRVNAALEALAKRAQRKGLTPIGWSWGKAYTSVQEVIPHPEYGWQVEYRVDVSRVPLTLTGDAPKYAGWTFAAALQHLDGENIVRSVDGRELPAMYRTRGPACDHCKTMRRRADTYVLRHDDGRMMQVGSTCIGDFLGCDDAGKVAAAASMIAEARALAEDGCAGLGAQSTDRMLSALLEVTAWTVREYGWTSRTTVRTTVRETGETGEGQATADRVWTFLTNRDAAKKANVAPTADDIALALSAETWAETLTDAQVDAERGDYLHNVRAIARQGLVTFRSAGIAASIVTAYQRFIARERQQAAKAVAPKLDAYTGIVGKREMWAGCTLDFVTGYDTQYGYTTILKFRTPAGACLVWKASSTDISRSDVGKVFTVVGTVKKHEEYKGEKQTIVTRCKVMSA